MRLKLALLLLLWQTPAYAAQWLEYTPGQSVPKAVWTSDNAPISGIDVSANSIVVPFVVNGNDTNPQNYVLQNGVAVYSPPPVVSPPPGPNLPGFIMAIRTEPTFNAQIRQGLAGLMPQVQMDLSYPKLLQQDWSDACANVQNSTWLTTDVQTTVQKYATTFLIPIVP